MRGRVDHHGERADRDRAQLVEPGRANAAAPARHGVVDILPGAGAVEPDNVDQVGSPDGGIALRITGVAIEALAFVGEDLGAALGGHAVAGLAGGDQQVFDHVADVAGLERYCR